jgi:hypothetical protein
MKKQTRMRLGLMLLVLTLVLGITSFADRNAEAYYCTSYGNCENCANIEQACMDGYVYPDCGGDYNCCSSRTSGCWRCCVWY